MLSSGAASRESQIVSREIDAIHRVTELSAIPLASSLITTASPGAIPLRATLTAGAIRLSRISIPHRWVRDAQGNFQGGFMRGALPSKPENPFEFPLNETSFASKNGGGFQ